MHKQYLSFLICTAAISSLAIAQELEDQNGLHVNLSATAYQEDPIYGKEAEQQEYSDLFGASSTGPRCQTIERNKCNEVCVVKARRPITIKGVAKSTNSHNGNWTEINLYAYDRFTGNLVEVDTQQNPSERAVEFIDLGPGDYRIVANQKNYLADCQTTYAVVFR